MTGEKQLKFSAGPQLREFARHMESKVEDVLAWANGQLNDPSDYYKQEYPTRESRMEALKGYIAWVNEYSHYENPAIGINNRIKLDLHQGKQAE